MGISLSEYEEMTPHELNLHIEEWSKRMQEESESRIIQAYLTAYWQRIQRMPNLNHILKDMRPKKEYTPEQLLAQIKAINAAMGGQVQHK